MKNRNKCRIAAGCLSVMVITASLPVMADYDDLILGTSDTGEEVLFSGEEEFEILFGTKDQTEVTENSQDPEKIQYSAVKDQGGERAGRNADPVLTALEGGISYLETNITNPMVESVGGEWSVMAMARNGRLSAETQKAYRVNLATKLEQVNGRLHGVKYTEYSRVIMALSSIGIDAHDVNGYDLIQPLAEFKKVIRQGINGPIFALIALDTRGYDVPVMDASQSGEQTTREVIINYILDKELPEGGWALQSTVPDDMTPMAIQALAPYYGRADVKTAVDKALDVWGQYQKPDGGYGSSDYGGGSESISQTVIALSALNIDPAKDERFIKNGNTLLDALMEYQQKDGSFAHIYGEGGDLMATDQAALALTAYSRFLNGQTRLYDMTDVPLQSVKDETLESVEAFRNRLYSIPQNPTLLDREEIMSLDVELSGMGNFSEKEDFRAVLESMKEEMKIQQEEVKALDQYIWDNINPEKITLADKDKVAQIRQRYMNMKKENRSFLEYAGDLISAESEILKLENGGAVFTGLKDTAQIPSGTVQQEGQSGTKNNKRPGGIQNFAASSSSAKTEKMSNTIDASIEDGMLKADAFEKIKGQDKNLKIENELEKDQVYTMTINGKDITEVKDLNTKLSRESSFEEDINKLAEDPYIFSFKEKSDFPGPMQVELPADLEKGEYLLLKYNEQERKAEYIQKVTVEDGKTKFIISEGGDYFLAKKAKNKSLNDIEQEDGLSEKTRDSEDSVVLSQKKEENEKTQKPVAKKDEISKEDSSEKKHNSWPIAAGVLGVVVIAAAGTGLWLKKKRG